MAIATYKGFALALATVLGMLPSFASESALSKKEITSYPFVATNERATVIRNDFKRITAGMHQTEVIAILGEPDEVHFLYPPQKAGGEVIGYTYWYVIRRLTKNGSANAKQESLVRVGFRLDHRVFEVSAWGL